MEYKQSESLFD